MVPYWMSRSELLLGEPTLSKLFDKHVLVVGLGGVGGICAEMIARSGVGKMTIVDADVVDLSNCNRQIAALHSTKGQLKAEVLGARLKDINPALELTIINQFLQDELTEQVVKNGQFDYAVDCIDTLKAKVQFIKTCVDNHLKIVSSMGAGGKIHPGMVQVADLSQTYECTLAKHVRRKLRELNIKKGVKAVFSPEKIDESRVIVTEKAFPKKSLIGTISYMPAIFGCVVASEVIKDLAEIQTLNLGL